MSTMHTMLWREDERVFRCRTGACRYECTEDQLKAAGYHVSKEGVVFIDEENFNEEDFDGENGSTKKS